jgi:DNA-binding XRE family transcriptional regulator
METEILRPESRLDLSSDWLQTSPDLFPNGKTTTRMASALPIWEASNILTQRKHLPWSADPKGKLRYARNVENGSGAVHFWVTEDLEEESPATLAGAAALAVIDTFDIRAACMHLIYAAHATQIDRPWEEEFVISDRQIEEYLGLKKRTDKNKQQKLALIQEIAKQPCKITTFVSWPTQSKVKGFTIEEGRLWHLLGTRYHYQQDLFGNKELSGVTFVVRAGLWARYFLNEEGRRNKSALCEYGTLSKSSLRDVMSVWQHREGAARLMVWLLFKTRLERQTPLPVQTLMEVAFGEERIEDAKQNSKSRKKFVSLWDDTLQTLHDRGWYIQFDPETYPPEIRPMGFGRSHLSRPRGFFEQLLNAHIWITPQDDWTDAAITVDPPPVVPEVPPPPSITGDQVKSLRLERGWSQRKLASLTGLSQGLISQIETGGRSLTLENKEILLRIFTLNVPPKMSH